MTADVSSVKLATELTVAWLSNNNNRVSAEDAPAFLRTMHATLTQLSAGVPAAEDGEHAAEKQYESAVSVRKSLGSRDHIISLIDGKKYKTLRRHLSTHGLTPEEYRERYNLKTDYPMVAPSYSKARSDMARKIGLGNKGRNARKAPATDAAAEVAAPKAKRAPRKPATELS